MDVTLNAATKAAMANRMTIEFDSEDGPRTEYNACMNNSTLGSVIYIESAFTTAIVFFCFPGVSQDIRAAINESVPSEHFEEYIKNTWSQIDEMDAGRSDYDYGTGTEIHVITYLNGGL